MDELIQSDVNHSTIDGDTNSDSSASEMTGSESEIRSYRDRFSTDMCYHRIMFNNLLKRPATHMNGTQTNFNFEDRRQA